MDATPERLAAWIDKLNAIADDMERFDNAAEFPAHIDSITSYLQAKRDEIIMSGPIVEFKDQRLTSHDLAASAYENYCDSREFRRRVADQAMRDYKARGGK